MNLILFSVLLRFFGGEGAAPLTADFLIIALGNAIIAVISREFKGAIAATAGGFAAAADGRLEVALDLSHVSHVVAAQTKRRYVLRVVEAGSVGGCKLRRPRTLLAHEKASTLDRNDVGRFILGSS